jgi:Cu-processing system ATP-binding protein
MIEVKGISKCFGKLHVLNNVNLQCGGGECIALIGPNACGKTTLIKCMLGMVMPDSGEVLFKGENIRKNYAYRERIGYMPQIGRYPDNMSIGQVIAMIRNIRDQGGKVDEELFDQFGLSGLMQKKMRTLSGGTTQKVSATLAFLFDPDVLILDEPTAGLDPISSEILKAKIIHEKQQGKLILITSHLLSELDDLVTQVVFMQEGRIVFHKNLDTLRSDTGEEKISRAIAKMLRQET